MHRPYRVTLGRFALALTCVMLVGGLSSSPIAADVHSAPGSLDESFDGDGRVLTRISTGDQAHAMAVQPDGRIVVAGYTEQGASGSDFTVFRYNPDGSLDATFGMGGWTTASFGTGASRDEAYAVALQPDGRIVVAGETWENGTTITRAAVARFLADGTLDPTFGADGNGTVIVPMGTRSTARAVAVRPDGRILIAGGMTTLSGGVGLWVGMAQLTSDGGLDPAFAGGGVVMTTVGNSSVAHAAVLQPDGRIVLAGRMLGGSQTFMIVLRYTPSGTPDLSFSGGNVQTQIGSGSVNVATALALTEDGKIVVGGFSNFSGFQMVVLRHNSNGSLDSTFDGDGLATHAMGGFGQAFAVAVDATGKILVAGDARGIGNVDIGLIRYQVDGTLDPTFGSGGVVTTDVGGDRNHGRAVFIQVDGRISVAGYDTASFTGGINVVRYHGDARNHLFTVTTAGDGAGVITSDPPAIDCGTVCSQSYPPGSVVTLTASAVAGSVFAGWSGDCLGAGPCQVTMDGPRSVTATFDLDSTPPETIITSAPAAVVSETTVTFSFAASEADSTFDCRVDAATPVPCNSPYSTAALPNGIHTFAVSAADAAGNRDPTPATTVFRVCAGPNAEAARAIDDVLRGIDVDVANRVLDRVCRPR